MNIYISLESIMNVDGFLTWPCMGRRVLVSKNLDTQLQPSCVCRGIHACLELL
jgi:hypothetical protein